MQQDGQKSDIEMKPDDSSKVVEHDVERQRSGPGRFQRLIVLAWALLFVDFLGDAVGLFDVREYYSLGRCGSAVLSGSLWVLEAWLCFALAWRKDWARKTYIVWSIVWAILASVWGILMLGEGIDGNLLVWAFDVVSIPFAVYCVYLLFCKDVVAAFLPSSRPHGSWLSANRFQCIAWWASLILVVAGVVCLMSIHEETGQWMADCKAAAVAGSRQAREEWIEKIVGETMLESGLTEDDAGYEEKRTEEAKEAGKTVDRYIRENRKP